MAGFCVQSTLLFIIRLVACCGGAKSLEFSQALFCPFLFQGQQYKTNAKQKARPVGFQERVLSRECVQPGYNFPACARGLLKRLGAPSVEDTIVTKQHKLLMESSGNCSLQSGTAVLEEI